jgi:hypothetical protein
LQIRREREAAIEEPEKNEKSKKRKPLPIHEGWKAQGTATAGEGELGKRQVWKVHCSEE